MRFIRAWLEASVIQKSYVPSSIFGGIVEKAVAPHSVSRRLKRLAEKAGLDAQTVRNLLSYTLRAGAAQEMAEKGFVLFALMPVGGWKTEQVVARYVEEARVTPIEEKRSKYVC